MDIIEEINSLNLSYPYKTNVFFAKNSWFGVGGLCNVVFKFDNIENLSRIIFKIPSHISVIPIGVTSNLLIKDEGFKGVIVRPKFLNIDLIDDETIAVGSGVLDSNVAKFCADNSIGGLEFLYTIPGTIGGAIAMNAGCYGCELSNVLISAKGVNRFTGEIKEFTKNDLGFSYRSNNIRDFIWVSAILKGKKTDNKEEIYQKMNKFLDQRNLSQPKSCKTGGSTFCNMDNYKAWQLIDTVGLRGHRIGGACFSEKHCNFIINDMNGKAQDIIDLIELAEELVLKKFNIKLKREIVII